MTTPNLNQQQVVPIPQQQQHPIQPAPQQQMNPSAQQMMPNLDNTAPAAMMNAQMNERLNEMWKEQLDEVTRLDTSSKNEFKHHNDLPLARIKRIMKSDEDVRMISAESPILFAKACEMFVLDVSVRSWCYTEHNKRNELEKEDIYSVLKNTDIFDFLAEVILNQGENALSTSAQN